MGSQYTLPEQRKAETWERRTQVPAQVQKSLKSSQMGSELILPTRALISEVGEDRSSPTTRLESDACSSGSPKKLGGGVFLYKQEVFQSRPRDNIA